MTDIDHAVARTTETLMHASESQHWSTRDGRPCYEVQAKNGSMRPATLRDARTMSLVPSVTAIIRCASAPGLELWKQQQVLHAALNVLERIAAIGCPRVGGGASMELKHSEGLPAITDGIWI